MDSKKVSCTFPFTGFDLYRATSYVQEHTLINRGITTLGGSTIPQCIMSNNKYETQERALMGGIYFVASYLTPILLIPLYNKHFLKNKGITKDLNSIGKKIIQVPKKFLKPDADLKKGLTETAKIFDKKGENSCETAFDEIYQRYNNPQKLKNDLLSVHEKVLMTDFITTAAMWSAIPWVATEFTEKRTQRHDFSAGFDLKKDTSIQNDELKKSKTKKLLWNILFCLLHGILYAKTVTKGLSKNNNNALLKFISNNPQKFDYTSGTNMSKTIYASIWALSSFPAKLISARDKNERRDRMFRDIGLFTMFFGGDFLINNIAGRISDKFFGTKVMDRKDNSSNFLKDFKLSLRNFKELEKDKTLSPEILRKTKNAGAGLYWVSLLINMTLIGFALPKVLNKLLRHNIKKEINNYNKQQEN